MASKARCKCGEKFKGPKRLADHCEAVGHAKPGWLKKLEREWAAESAADPVDETEPDWDGECEVCGASPIVPLTGMCGPCTFGEAETVGGNW